MPGTCCSPMRGAARASGPIPRAPGRCRPGPCPPWLATRAEQVAAAGAGALDALLRLALAGHPGRGESAAPVRHRAGPPAAPAGAARWARTHAPAVRDGDWVVVAGELLKDAVDAEHAGHLPCRRCWRVHTDQDATALADLELQEAIARQSADRLPGHEVAGLLRELAAAVHGSGGRSGGPAPYAVRWRGCCAATSRRPRPARPGTWSSTSTSTSTRSALVTRRPSPAHCRRSTSSPPDFRSSSGCGRGPASRRPTRTCAPVGAERVDGSREPLASWLRVGSPAGAAAGRVRPAARPRCAARRAKPTPIDTYNLTLKGWWG